MEKPKRGQSNNRSLVALLVALIILFIAVVVGRGITERGYQDTLSANQTLERMVSTQVAATLQP